MKFTRHDISAALRRPDKAAVCFFAAAAATSVLLSALLFYVPLALDDLWFLDGIHTSPGPATFSAACKLLAERLSTDTGRLGAIISPIFLALLPKCVYNILTGLIFFFLATGACLLARVRFGGLWSYLILAFCAVGLPWYDYLVILTYGINYIWAGTAAVWAAWILLTPERVRGRWQVCGAMLLCFVAGCMHEGFGIPLSAAALVVLLDKRERSPHLKYVAATIAGTAMTAISPAIWNRLFYTASAPSVRYPLSELAIHFGPLAVVLGIYFTILLLTLLSPHRRLNRVGSLFFITFIIVAAAIAIIFYCGPRITTPAILFAAIATIRLLAPRLRPLSRPLSAGLSLAVVLFLILHLAYAIVLQYRLLSQFREIESLFAASSTGEVYVDLIEPSPDLTLFKTTVRQFHEYVPRDMFSRYYAGSDSGKRLKVIPSFLRRFDPREAVPSTLTPGLCIYRGALVLLPKAEACPPKGRIELTTESGRVIESRYRTQTFITPDSLTCTLVTPHACILDPSLVVADARFL